MITLSNRKIYFLGLVFLIIPLAIWCFGWMNAVCAFFVVALLAASLVLIWVRTEKKRFHSADLTMSTPLVVAIIITIAIWCILGGQGGFICQSSDWGARNAVLHDLIMYDWPVVYENDGALCYYFGFWLVPAVVGKLFLSLGLSVSASWIAANAALLLWTMCGVFLAVMLFLQCVKCTSAKMICGALLLFIFFSGMDIVGLLLTGNPAVIEMRLFEKIHIEWWASVFQFSSFTTQLFWVFNQAVPAWIATLLILSTSRVDNDIFIGMLSAFLCPLPTMGLLFIGFAKLVTELKETGWRTTGKALLSPQNLIALIPLIAIAMFLLLSQRAAPVSSTTCDTTTLFHTYIGGITLNHVLRLGLFFFLECGILLALLLPSERKNPYWWGVLILLLVANVTRMGPSPDFSMRASIPGLMVMLVMLAKHLLAQDFCSYYQWIKERHKRPIEQRKARLHSKAIGVALVVCLAIGAITPLVEMLRGPIRTIETQQIPVLCDEVESFNNSLSTNFVTPDYEDSTFAQTIGK